MPNVRLHHGTDIDSAIDLANNGIDGVAAARYNVGGEFWATTRSASAEWFAHSNPAGGVPAVFVFELPEAVLQLLLNRTPKAAFANMTAPGTDYEFLRDCFRELNQAMTVKTVIVLP